MLDPWPAIHAAYLVLQWGVRLLALAVVPLRRHRATNAGWLLLILVFPVPGMLAFAAIGRPRFPASRMAAFHLLAPYLSALASRLEGTCAAAEGEGGADRETAALARTLGLLPATGGNTVELIDEYDEVIARLTADVDAARREVLILVYIFADDRVGRLVAAALGRAVRRGVRCRVLLDPVGSGRWRRAVTRRLESEGVEVRHSLPFRWWRGRTRRDMRNHRKLFVIDGAVGFAGSQNIVARDFRPGVVNRELVARVTGPVVAEMVAVVLADWFLETGEMPAEHLCPVASTGRNWAQLLPSGATYPLEGFETILVWQVHRARRRVVLVTPYLIPDDALLSALTTAATRGVAVEVVVSVVVDQWLVNLAQCSYYEELLACGVHIHLFRDELLHAKNVSIDGLLAIVGSSNVDLRSFELNEEVSLLLYGAGPVARLEAVQQGYIDRSDRLDPCAWRARPRLRRFAENMARLVSPLL